VVFCGILYSVLSVSTLWDSDGDAWRSSVDRALVKRTQALWVNLISGESACRRAHAKGEGGGGKEKDCYICAYINTVSRI